MRVPSRTLVRAGRSDPQHGLLDRAMVERLGSGYQFEGQATSKKIDDSGRSQRIAPRRSHCAYRAGPLSACRSNGRVACAVRRSSLPQAASSRTDSRDPAGPLTR